MDGHRLDRGQTVGSMREGGGTITGRHEGVSSG